jgi:hypothetical protein
MRTLLALAAAAALTGCLSQESYSEQYVEKFCEVYDACDTSGRDCPIDLESVTSSANCEFDKQAARECLKAEFGCDESIPGFEVITQPEACLLVCGQEVVDEDTDAG